MSLRLPWSRSPKPNKPAKPPVESEDEDQHYRPIEWSLVRRLLASMRPYRRIYILAISLGLVHIVLEMQSPRFMQEIINYVTAYGSGKLGPAVDSAAATRHVLAIVGVWALAVLASMVLLRYTILFMTRAGEQVQFNLRRRIFEHLQRLSMSYYDRTKLGRIISRCTSDAGGLREVNVWGVWSVAANLLMMIVAAVMMFRTEWRLFLAVAWLGPVLACCNQFFRNRISGMWQVAREGYTRVATNLAENITGTRVVTAFNRQSPNLTLFNTLQAANTSNNVRVSRMNGLYQPSLQLVGFVGKVIILTYGAYLLVSGRLPREKGIGAVIAAFLYWDWFMAPILNFGNFYNQLMMAMAGAERVFSLLDTRPEVQDLPDAPPLPALRGQVVFDDVTFGYNADRPVLHEVCFEARPGQTIALVGATGSGKSSIISLLARFYQPQRGRILVDGHDIRFHTADSLHRQMGLVLQVNYLFSGTVLDNIRYARPDATEEQVRAAARAIGSLDAIESLKDGFGTQVGERGANMSLGQRQLICFARAFLADPRILMLDEATSSVDTETEMLVQRSLEKLLENRTTFIVAHRLSTILRADCILVIDAGRIVERGTHRELLALDGRYAQLYQQFIRHAA